MKKYCIFTICSKNYLAQALTLKESVHKQEDDCDFYIFLADKRTEEIDGVKVEELDEEWIPKWKEMAFKYDVIEFNTAIKPFCFRKLFQKGYRYVVFLDPDMYVTGSLSYIWGKLEVYSIILTPHMAEIEYGDKGILQETDLLMNGIYNLGFVALSNNEIGKKIVEWWCIKLEKDCFNSSYEGLFVDQKWMIFIPGYFPQQTLITRHPGINIGYWNLHERELKMKEGKYFAKFKNEDEEYPLLVYHFSGFKPSQDRMITAHQPQFDIDLYPSFEPIIKEYKELETKNGYDRFSKMHYSLNEFSDGTAVTGYHRRLYRACLMEYENQDPFSTTGELYKNLERSKLLVKRKNAVLNAYGGRQLDQTKRKRYMQMFEKMARLLRYLMGVEKYFSILAHCRTLFYVENQTFLMRDMKKVDKNEFYTERIKRERGE